jgi:uncharacterized protein (DUF2249 family)
MNISANTRISYLIKQNPAAIDAIVSINKHFEKLRNPVLRKILASRVTIADAAKIGGCTVNYFFEKLLPLGFKINSDTSQISTSVETANESQVFMKEVASSNTTTLDVRADIASGKDPFQKIMNTLSSVPQGNFLLIINSFEPIPLINILKKKGFEYYTEQHQEDLFHTYFIGRNHGDTNKSDNIASTYNTNDEFEKMLYVFERKMITIDVRNLEMPLPMVTILKELETLPEGQALFVQHKKVPQFLLPELQERNFFWLIREDGEGNVKLLIFR